MTKEERKIKNTSIIDTEGLETADEQINEVVDSANIEFNDNDIVKGKVVKIERDEVLVDIGFKSEGVVPLKELTIRRDVNPADVVSIGDEIEALVVSKEDNEGRLILSKKRADYEKAWRSASEKYKSGEIITGEVIEIVRGGLIVDIGLRAFLPASLVELHRVRELEGYLGNKIEVRIIEMDKLRNNVVLSRKVLLEEGRHNEKIDILSKLSPGMKLKGKVSSIVDFGAFIDLGGIDGLVHISEISWEHINHPSEVLAIGDEVDVVVLDVDLDRERISLGIKQTTEDPWVSLAKQYPVDTIADVEVVRLVPFGAFVKLSDDVEGLVHVSEMAHRHINNPNQVVHIGDVVKAMVTGVNEDKHRISLSMREAANELGYEIEVAEEMPSDVTSRNRSKKLEAKEDSEKSDDVKDEKQDADKQEKSEEKNSEQKDNDVKETSEEKEENKDESDKKDN